MGRAVDLFTRFFLPDLSPERTRSASGGGLFGPFIAAAQTQRKGLPHRKWSGVGDHARYLCVVAVGNDHALAELALQLGGLGRKDVPRLRLVADNFARASLLEALGRARMGLQLRHFFLVLDQGFARS